MSKKRPIELTWDSGTAYDMFVSLNVLHHPEKYGLRGSWAAGVRSRLPLAEREFLQEVVPLLWPFDWVFTLPEPKDGAVVLSTLAALQPEERIPALQSLQLGDEPETTALLRSIAARGAWTEDDLRDFMAFLAANDEGHKTPTAAHRKMAVTELKLWADLQTSGEMVLSALTAYYDSFYAEEELRIHDALETALENAKAAAVGRSITELLEELSQGLVLRKAMNMDKLVLVPSFWATPLIIFARVDATKEMYLFGARPADMSLVPGEVVPDALSQALKALADPTRLRILRYLTVEPSTPADLARRLRLRAPTVIHHLDTLRLARLVQLTLSHEGKRYAIREEAVDRTFAMLSDFLGAADAELALEMEEHFATE